MKDKFYSKFKFRDDIIFLYSFKKHNYLKYLLLILVGILQFFTTNSTLSAQNLSKTPDKTTFSFFAETGQGVAEILPPRADAPEGVNAAGMSYMTFGRPEETQPWGSESAYPDSQPPPPMPPPPSASYAPPPLSTAPNPLVTTSSLYGAPVHPPSQPFQYQIKE